MLRTQQGDADQPNPGGQIEVIHMWACLLGLPLRHFKDACATA
jgi:hypothetical protein